MKIEKDKISLKMFFGTSDHVRWSILFGVTIFFTIFLYPNLIIKKHSYKLGDVAASNIKATKDFLIEDRDATEANRSGAVEKVLTFYDHDVTLSSTINQNVKIAFKDIRMVFNAEKNQNKIARKPSKTASTGTFKRAMSVHDLIWQKKVNFEEKIGISVSDGAYKILEKEAFLPEIANLICSILKEILDNGVVTNKELLLKETDKGIILRDITTKKELVIHKLKHFYGLDQAKTMVKIIGQPFLENIDYTLRNMIVDFAQRLIQPNITLNRSETEERKKKADAEIKPVFHKIKAGEMLLREGERVTKVQLLKLKAYEEGIRNEQILSSSIGSALIILCILMTTYMLYIHRQSQTDLSNNKNLLFMASVLVTFFFIARISASLAESMAHYTSFPISAASSSYGIPLAAGAMAICLFLGLELAIPMAMLIAIGTAIIFKNRFDIFLYFLINSSMAAFWMQNCRERKVFIKAGLKLGLLNVILVTVIDTYLGGSS
ncbi:MAG: HD family phosphohydrolase, partial [Thermodesulfobacteriota bacterium]|nr:HD family phosphohydrolase [Thermodesulfobacteriota bacterium]